MKNTILAFAALVISLPAFARDIDVNNCDASGVSFNQVLNLRSYSNGQIKTFELDMVEPAAASAAVVVTLDRGDDLSTMESFCKVITGLSSADVTNAQSSYDASTNTLTLTMAASQTDDSGNSQSKTLTVRVNKNGRSSNVVRASIR